MGAALALSSLEYPYGHGQEYFEQRKRNHQTLYEDETVPATINLKPPVKIGGHLKKIK